MPKKRILPYVLLGLINDQKKLSGYQITKEFKHEISDFWKASHSQIYPELQRMVDDDWIKPVILSALPAANRKQTFYALTSTGKATLIDWLHEPLTEKNADLFSLKLFFLKDKDSALLLSIMTRQLTLSQNRVAHLKSRQQMLFQSQTDIEQHYGHYLILSRGIERESNYVHWIKELLSKY